MKSPSRILRLRRLHGLHGDMSGKTATSSGAATRLSFRTACFDRLIAANQDAFILLTVLKRHHWGRDFVLSKNMADTFGWGLRRWKPARDVLVRFGIITCIHAGGMGSNDPPIYAWSSTMEWGVNV